MFELEHDLNLIGLFLAMYLYNSTAPEGVRKLMRIAKFCDSYVQQVATAEKSQASLFITLFFRITIVLYSPNVRRLFSAVPESLRWLVVQSKHEEAMRVLRRTCRINGTTLPENIDLQLLEKVNLLSHFRLTDNVYNKNFAKC